MTALIILQISGGKTPSSASTPLSGHSLGFPVTSSGQQPPNPGLTLHAVGAPAFPFGVLRTGKVGENGLPFVLLHSPAEVLETRHTHLLVVGHRESAQQTVAGVWVTPLGGGAPCGAERSCFRVV